VDEDGNPIEAGKENIIYVDEDGNEIPEDIAYQLIDSGRYVDLRDSYQSPISYDSYEAPKPQKTSYFTESQPIIASSATQSYYTNVSYVETTKEPEMIKVEPEQYKQEQVYIKSSSEVQKSQSTRRVPEPPPKRVESQKNLNDLEQLNQKKEIERELERQIEEEREREREREKERLRKRENELEAFKRKQEKLQRRLLEKQQQLLREQKRQQEQHEILSNESIISSATSILSKRESHNVSQISSSFFAQNIQDTDSTSSNNSSSTNGTVRGSGSGSSTSGTVSNVTKDKDSIKQITTGLVKEFENANFKAQTVVHVGYLRGKEIITNFQNINYSQFDKFYKSKAQIEDGKKENEENEGANERKNANDNDDENLFTSDYFKDEVIDIDYGAIDAFTSALNVQLNDIEKLSGDKTNELRFPSHILTSNHATFIDNQLLLGDYSYAYDDTPSKGINVQFMSSFNDFQIFNQQQQTNEAENRVYSRSESFGSIIDVQSQAAFSNCNQQDFNSSNNFNFSTNNLNKNLSSNYFETSYSGLVK
jgi:hypothetical protein